jgi:16S rRNA C967 or C1407 C5-methylase (RsmB/RsmF family)
MRFEHDHPKYGGRKAGTPNKPKPTLLAMLRERYPDFHPILAMVELYHDAQTPMELRVRLLNDIASYTVPRIKPMEFTEAQRLTDEAISVLASGEREPIDTFIEAFLNGRLSAGDLSSLVAALSLKQKPQGQGVIDAQAEILRLIK